MNEWKFWPDGPAFRGNDMATFMNIGGLAATGDMVGAFAKSMKGVVERRGFRKVVVTRDPISDSVVFTLDDEVDFSVPISEIESAKGDHGHMINIAVERIEGALDEVSGDTMTAWRRQWETLKIIPPGRVLVNGGDGFSKSLIGHEPWMRFFSKASGVGSAYIRDHPPRVDDLNKPKPIKANDQSWMTTIDEAKPVGGQDIDLLFFTHPAHILDARDWLKEFEYEEMGSALPHAIDSDFAVYRKVKYKSKHSDIYWDIITTCSTHFFSKFVESTKLCRHLGLTEDYDKPMRKIVHDAVMGVPIIWPGNDDG